MRNLALLARGASELALDACRNARRFFCWGCWQNGVRQQRWWLSSLGNWRDAVECIHHVASPAQPHGSRGLFTPHFCINPSLPLEDEMLFPLPALPLPTSEHHPLFQLPHRRYRAERSRAGWVGREVRAPSRGEGKVGGDRLWQPVRDRAWQTARGGVGVKGRVEICPRSDFGNLGLALWKIRPYRRVAVLPSR